MQSSETFDLEDCYGCIAPRYQLPNLAAEIRRLSDPETAEETIHWGRNYLYRSYLETAAGRLDVVVKQYRNQSSRQRLNRRLRGSRAARSYKTARAFQAAGIPTAEAILLVESKRPDGPSLFVSRYLDDLIEARYLLRAANQNLEQEQFPDVDMNAFLDALGATLWRMHEAGFFHRDLSIGNVLLPKRFPANDSVDKPRSEAPEENAQDRLFVIDLSRTRQRKRVNLSQRTRDLCRLAIFRPEHQERFLAAYWGAEAPSQEERLAAVSAARSFLFRLYHHGFRSRIASKKAIRKWSRSSWQWLLPRHAHAHIPEAPEDASARDKIVWDYLSDQPHQHANRFEKLRVRIQDAPSHLRQTASFLRATPRVMRRYRELKENLYSQPLPWDGVGIGIRPYPEAPDQLLEALGQLGVDKILLRLHPWDDDHEAEESLAKELIDRGYELAFALPQNRDLVRDPVRWRRKIEELAERFTPYGRQFQVGQAINRSKWGIWRYSEYQELAASAAEILRQSEGVEILGPAVIDFEFPFTASVLNLRGGVHFDILSSLLYVDRRGAPEHTQLGFDTVGKVVLLKAMADTAQNCDPRCWITEVNWPLWEGPHSPAGRSVSVSPESQADFLVRYFLLALTTGAVERVYWWQLIARGYGLMVPGPGSAPDRIELVRRPAFNALATLTHELRGCRFIGPLPSSPQVHLFLFDHPEKGECVAAWSTNGPSRTVLPKPACAVVEQDGQRIALSVSHEVEVSSTVRYFRF